MVNIQHREVYLSIDGHNSMKVPGLASSVAFSPLPIKDVITVLFGMMGTTKLGFPVCVSHCDMSVSANGVTVSSATPLRDMYGDIHVHIHKPAE